MGLHVDRFVVPADWVVLSDEQKAQRTILVAEMMQANTVLQAIHFSDDYSDNTIYSEKILPSSRNESL
jgi:hypothetical protein